jgi:hypothetical protein
MEKVNAKKAPFRSQKMDVQKINASAATGEHGGPYASPA